MARSKAQAETLRQILLAAVAKYARKEHERDALAEGGDHTVGVSIVGTIDGKRMADEFTGRLTVGYDQERASSVACSMPGLLAWILEQYVDRSKHEKLLAELPAVFDDAGGRLPIERLDDPGLADRCDALLKKLRAKTTTTARGNVSLNYQREG